MLLLAFLQKRMQVDACLLRPLNGDTMGDVSAGKVARPALSTTAHIAKSLKH